MAESNFVDSLPSGWTMKERIRENGKRDKFYYAPKNGPTFNSRVEVYRYLSGNRIKHYRVKRKKKLALKQPWKISADAIKKQISVVRGTIDSGQSSAMNDRQRYHKKLPEKSEVMDSPRRSKRLAGIEVDSIGLKPKTRTRRNKAKLSDNELAVTSDHSNGDHSNGVLLGEFLSDPCIAFAIKTLTGLTFDGVEEIRPERAKSEDEKVVASRLGLRQSNGQHINRAKDVQ